VKIVTKGCGNASATEQFPLSRHGIAPNSVTNASTTPAAWGSGLMPSEAW